MTEIEDIPRDDIIKHNIEAFLPYICECVKATDLLVHLHYFSRAQRKEIFSLCGQNNVTGMQKAMEVLMNDTDDEGRFTAFRDAIEDCRYPKIIKMLDGESVPCDVNCRKVIDLFAQEIISRLNPEDLLPRLVSQGTLTGNDAEEVRAEERNHGKRRACWVLLFHLPNRVENWFRDFMEALLECEYNDIAEILDPDMYQKIMAQRKEASSKDSATVITDDIRENVLEDNNFDSTLEKENFEEPEKGNLLCSNDNVDILTKKMSDKFGIESLVNGIDSMTMDEGTVCKQLVDQDVTGGTMRNEGIVDVNDDLTEVKRLAQGCKGDKSQTDTERWKRAREVSHQLQPDEPFGVSGEEHTTTTDVVYDNNLEDITVDIEAETLEDTFQESLNFDFVLTGETDTGNNEAGTAAGANNITELVDDASGTVADTNNGLERNTRNPNENITAGIIYTRREVPIPERGLAEGNMIAMAFDLQNNLNIEGEQSDQSETEYNITTDEDEVEAEDVDIPLREYQKELAKEGSEGENVIVMAPTNTGKTRVACRIMQVHLRRKRQSGNIGKVIFLVENEALASQQGKVCAELLPAYRTKVISGSVQRDKKQYLRDFIDRRDILVVTAQVLLNALKQKEVDSITRFSMIVFDECHHTDNYHRFNEIMSRYLDLKLRENLDTEQLPQIVGLTASLGVGGNTKHDAAMSHMKSLLANLDAKFLCTVRRNKEELRRHENNPVEEIVAARKRVNDTYRNAILLIMDIIDEYMIGHPSMETIPQRDAFIRTSCRLPSSRGSEKFLQWISAFKKDLGRLGTDTVRRMMNPCRIHLEVYNKALLIHADARIKDAEQILEDFMEEEREVIPKNETDVMLLELYDNLKRNKFTDEPENPKLLKMEEIVMRIFNQNEDARGIIFVKTRELAQALVNWMKETEPLDALNASEFVGQAAAKAVGGMTKCGQKDVLDYFKGGRHKIIIATSVAEEGLDITKCNLVIRYEHVTNEIVRLQSRGRARQQDSRYYVLTEEGSWIVAKEEKNALLEKVMNIIVPKLQAYIEDHPNLWERELREMQEKLKLQEELKQEQRRANMTNAEQEFRCLNCNHFICFLSDIRKIQGAHHVVVDEEVSERLISFRNPHPRFIDEELKFDGAIFCGNPDCQRELGGVCEYKHAEFPLLKIKNFRVVSRNGVGNTFKQWKKANFEVEPFTLEDLRDVVERRRRDM
ncbi:ATP-dependent RNA helicase DHX58-like isoform X2 [Mercenaria mercenaria]|uniref:ATP-dependent RNA helicase DHX58-like isoform X2 n=1 Tax=Mercenaria mercenaria TaxID=6596 RepID=UPI00234F63AA|nr:ATP-dependent RNA helicase DHX58-like isoform X2 [Mercenaria mercenaria]